MFKRLFLGNTNIDFHNIGSRFYKIFIIEFIIFSAVLIGSIFGFLNLNLSVDFTAVSYTHLTLPTSVTV